MIQSNRGADRAPCAVRKQAKLGCVDLGLEHREATPNKFRLERLVRNLSFYGNYSSFMILIIRSSRQERKKVCKHNCFRLIGMHIPQSVFHDFPGYRSKFRTPGSTAACRDN
jgi:hypothetical protein